MNINHETMTSVAYTSPRLIVLFSSAARMSSQDLPSVVQSVALNVDALFEKLQQMADKLDEANSRIALLQRDMVRLDDNFAALDRAILQRGVAPRPEPRPLPTPHYVPRPSPPPLDPWQGKGKGAAAAMGKEKGKWAAAAMGLTETTWQGKGKWAAAAVGKVGGEDDGGKGGKVGGVYVVGGGGVSGTDDEEGEDAGGVDDGGIVAMSETTSSCTTSCGDKERSEPTLGPLEHF